LTSSFFYNRFINCRDYFCPQDRLLKNADIESEVLGIAFDADSKLLAASKLLIPQATAAILELLIAKALVTYFGLLFLQVTVMVKSDSFYPRRPATRHSAIWLSKDQTRLRLAASNSDPFSTKIVLLTRNSARKMVARHYCQSRLMV